MARRQDDGALAERRADGDGADRDPIASTGEGGGGFTIPRWPVRRRVQGLSRFVVTRGGEYCFMPGLRALRWLAALGA